MDWFNWSHGDGWLPYPLRAGTRWVGQDKGNGDNRMNISEFVEILKSAPLLILYCSMLVSCKQWRLPMSCVIIRIIV